MSGSRNAQTFLAASLVSSGLAVDPGSFSCFNKSMATSTPPAATIACCVARRERLEESQAQMPKFVEIRARRRIDAARAELLDQRDDDVGGECACEQAGVQHGRQRFDTLFGRRDPVLHVGRRYQIGAPRRAASRGRETSVNCYTKNCSLPRNCSV